MRKPRRTIRNSSPYRAAYEYDEGYYDRTRKEFYGFQYVTSTRFTDSEGNNPDGTMVREYYNRDYYSKGMLKSETCTSEDGNETRRSEYVIDSVYPRVKQETHIQEKGGETIGRYSSYEYDEYGNVTTLSEGGSGIETVRAEIAYWNNDRLYLHARSTPKKERCLVLCIMRIRGRLQRISLGTAMET